MCENYDCQFSATVAEPIIRATKMHVAFQVHVGRLEGLGYKGRAAILLPVRSTAASLAAGLSIALHQLGSVMSVALTPARARTVVLYKPRDTLARRVNGPIVSLDDSLAGEHAAIENGMPTLLGNQRHGKVARETIPESRYVTTLQPIEFKLNKNFDGHYFAYLCVILNDETGHAVYHLLDTTIPGAPEDTTSVKNAMRVEIPELQGKYRLVILGALSIEDEQSYRYQDIETYVKGSKDIDDDGNEINTTRDDDEMPVELKALIDKLVSDHPDVQVSAHKINLGKKPPRRSMTDKAIQDTMSTLVKNPEAVADAMRRSLEVRAKLGDQAGAKAFSDTMMHLLYDDEMGAATVTELLAAVDSGNFDKVKEAFAAKQAAHS